ncbi:MAG: penicillin-binding protein [Ruminococcus sp.]|nr:penicillin-binding protein [Ruminococcus sp.]
MKRTLRRSTLILIFTIAFIVGIGFFVVELAVNAKDWVDQPYNAHISGSGGLEQAGKILDRNDAPLAQTIDGERVYHENESVRKALLHTVGDNSLNISTAVQSKYRSNLTGYSLIWGLNMPQSMRSSRDIMLTVDAETCASAYNMLQTGFEEPKRGACVIYNYKTGEVICSVSTPGYDPQDPPRITEENESLYDGVYLDNVLSSTFTPGSIFKIVTAAAAIENIPDIYERTWYCEGIENIGGHEVHCYNETAHGEINIQEAMQHSCNIVFAKLAVELGSDKMNAMAEKMGINMSFEIDDVMTAKGHYNAPKNDENTLAWTGVGQGVGEYEDKVNPMQMAIICGAVANQGTAVNPSYIKSGTGDLLKEIGMKPNKTYSLLSADTASQVGNIMPTYSIGGLTVRAKTGTAEVGNDKQPNAWFVGYATDADCPLAFACVVQDSGMGGEYAIPVIEATLSTAAERLRGSMN